MVWGFGVLGFGDLGDLGFVGFEVQGFGSRTEGLALYPKPFGPKP